MSHSILDHRDLPTLEYIVTQVFFPLKFPDADDNNIHNNYALAAATASAGLIYAGRTDGAALPQWDHISTMLGNLRAAIQFNLDRSWTISQLSRMNVGDTLTFLIRAQNAAVIFRKQKDVTVFESFEVSPTAKAVMAAQGKLVCSYPGPAIDIPNDMFQDENFVSGLVDFLVHMDQDILGAPLQSREVRTAVEIEGNTHPRYITELLTGILRSVGRPANIIRVSKRVGDESSRSWRRSPVWLFIRVSLQTSLERSNLGLRTYKEFLLFFMCCLAQEEISADLPNHLLQCMSVKISRRLRKLGSSAPDWLSNTALEACKFIGSTLEKRWGQVQAAQCIPQVWNPSRFNAVQDSQLSLLKSGDYLRSALANHSTTLPNTPFTLEHRPRCSLDDFLSSDGIFKEAYHTEPHVALYDVECAVERGIDAWVDRAGNSDEACVKLEALANKYSLSALETYGTNPELLSVMLLTAIELWVALDKIAIKAIPMLADYSPEIPTSLLENMLLSKSGNLSRLGLTHQYLSNRYSQSQSRWSVFSPSIKEDSFSVRFYRGSSHLQRLKARIEGVAQREVHEKVVELERENARHAELRELAARTEHQGFINEKGHRNRCKKCHLESELGSMVITIHEWPLPPERLHAEAVVFELDCPISFNMWRAATLHLLVDLCSPSVDPKHTSIRLEEYTALKPYLVLHPRSRITLASDTQPFVARKSKTRIPTKQSAICVRNGLNFYGFDKRARIPISQALGRVDIRKYCTYQLQSGPYHNLQKYVGATSHTSNEIMANQADCHKDLSVHEFIAFGHLRSGGLLQWFNILREFRARSLSFRRAEVHFLLAQASSQAGPFVDEGWAWHDEIRQPPFCYALLGEFESLMRDIETNWLGAVTMDTISFLLRRLLASSPSEGVMEKVVELLRIARGKVFSWVQDLWANLATKPEDEELRGLLRDAAAICRGTVDVDPSIIRGLLHSAEDIEALLSSAVLIHDHTPSKVSSLSPYSQLLLDRDRRVSLALESVLSEDIRADSIINEGMNLAIRKVWPHYRRDSEWIPLQGPNSRWVTCATAAKEDQLSQVVHFNLLDGSLLVNGKPLGRLPREIQKHPLYNLIFGESVLDILPSDLPGMVYATRDMVYGHQVHFSLRNGGRDLVIQARVSSKSETIELIPQEKLEGDLPRVLIKGHAHWLNLSTSIMVIRPLDNLWQGSSENWEMNCALRPYRMCRGRERLIDIQSRSWTMISGLLKPLEIPQNLLVTASTANSDQSSWSLQVSLPRYRLSFYVDQDGDLQSHNIRGMVYDKNQSIGTLFGLFNRLVLRPKPKGNVDADKLVPRCVVIPEGDVSSKIDGHHVRVNVDISNPAHQQFTYQIYRIDTDLGCLTGNGSLTSKLYCAFLHAVTSGCGTDLLTGRSGAEEALSLLQSASCKSIMKFTFYDAELLSWIASVGHPPFRMSHSTTGQKAERYRLPDNSQYFSELHLASTEIKEHVENVQLLHEGQPSMLFERFPSYDGHTLQRSARRAAYLFPSEYSAQPHRTNADVWYPSRDLVQDGSREHHAYIVATAVFHRTANKIAPDNVLGIIESRKGTVKGDARLSLRYDKSWLAPDLPTIWLTTYKLLRRSDEGKWSQLLFSLPAMAYFSPELARLVPAFIAFAADPRFSSEDPPNYDSYTLAEGYHPSATTLRGYISSCAHPFEDSPESTAPAQPGESAEEWEERRHKMFNERLKLDADATVEWLMSTWPCETPSQCTLRPDSYNVVRLTSMIQKHFSRRYRNLKLKEHFARVQNILKMTHIEAFPTPTYSFSTAKSILSRPPWSLTMEQLLTRPVPSLQAHDRLPQHAADTGRTSSSDLESLHQLIDTAEDTVVPFQQQYVLALRTSVEFFERETSSTAQRATDLPTAETLLDHYDQCRANYTKNLGHLKQHMGPKSQSEIALEQSGQWPRITPHALFRSLASNSPIVLSDDWKRCLIQLILLALELQRARRLLRLHLYNLHEELHRELQNEGCDGWSAELHPDWLLIQLQGDFLVRRVQADVANEMIAPRSGNNTAMQLNMGEGKSSVIIPIIVAVLADGNQLVRVIVPKALVTQTFHVLADRLGGFVNRRAYFLPFSRSLKVDDQKVAVIHKLMSQCMKERGVLVIQPEHILSLKLVSVEKQLPQASDSRLAKALLNLQKWLHTYSRDILDESDEILHVRFQLVHTIGDQQHIQGFPGRWTITQQVLRLVGNHASTLQQHFQHRVEHDLEQVSSGSFRHLRILHADAGQQLVLWLVEDIMNGLLPNLSFAQLPLDLMDTVRKFISCRNVTSEIFQRLEEYAQQTPLWDRLLLLRGLLATGILLFAFTERRWRVDYGLAPSRTMLAVPYRAKDVPAQRAEFGHPDVAIVLTCLSYYYGGLNEEQLRVSFEILLKQDDPSLDYDLWIRDCPDVPDNLRTISGINIKSTELWKGSLVPLFSRNQATVDFYLSNVVFPKEAKEFPSKLSCSGWDLAEKKERLVTGFSGTNDGQYLLPVPISQRDPDHQQGTNAKVLSYLLRPENKRYMCTAKEGGERRGTREFLELLVDQKPEIRVLLDVGAQMLDLQNDELAAAWLSLSKEASAAIYFNGDDELTVRTRDGITQLLRSSPFAQQLDQCVVYLDDAHTRGTDIKFPRGFRAAVTLGPKVTKDRLAQGCMRMRQLGHGHSIMFFAPLEVDRSIRSIAGKDGDPSETIESLDILHWAIRGSCDDIQQRAPSWAQQGINHISRCTAWTNFSGRRTLSEELSEKWLQREAKKLEELYGRHDTSSSPMLGDPEICSRCEELGVVAVRDVDMDEEQEREVIHEAEHEPQVERPPRAQPASHSIHEDVISFVTTGVLPTNTSVFRPVFETLGTTSAATDEAYVWSRHILATADFQKAVSLSKKLDGYLRPVQWVISGESDDGDVVLVILSPYEANRLLPYIRSHDNAHLHVYTPRVTKSMKSCDDLALYSIPARPFKWTPPRALMDQLNVFAGQLYLKDYKTYIRLYRFLSVYAGDLVGEVNHVEVPGRFIPPTVYIFSRSPMASVRALVSLRRKGMRFDPTHMGNLLEGRPLSQDDFRGSNEDPEPDSIADWAVNSLRDLASKAPDMVYSYAKNFLDPTGPGLGWKWRDMLLNTIPRRVSNPDTDDGQYVQ